ncbi:hypothetical protein B1H18_25065 [Streptomyces tsukubensis]|uniref:STAS domain-containing protein n=1 Tax=Streptomyces tsukubensis TaxID=83656 RepID=A0A1V4A438_9ACTN|nr:hypothetical protein B1H18_25065 [Streptomyces tsukubensis]
MGLLYVTTDDTTTLILTGPVRDTDVPHLCDRLARTTLGAPDADEIICDVTALTTADLATVNALARLRLTAQRLGYHLTLRGPSHELRFLLGLVGLSLLEETGTGTGTRAGTRAVAETGTVAGAGLPGPSPAPAPSPPRPPAGPGPAGRTTGRSRTSPTAGREGPG